MGISSEVKDDIFIRTIVPNIFSSDCEDSDSERDVSLQTLTIKFFFLI